MKDPNAPEFRKTLEGIDKFHKNCNSLNHIAHVCGKSCEAAHATCACGIPLEKHGTGASGYCEPILEEWEEELKRKIFAFRPLGYSFYGLDVIRFFRTKRLQWVSQAKAEARKEMAEEIRKGLLAMGAVSINGSEMLVELDKVVVLLNKTK